MYDVGTWVKVGHVVYKDYLGFVVDNNAYTKEHLIRVTIGKWGKPVSPKENLELEFHQDYLYNADIEPDLEEYFDTSFVKDLAIDWSLVQWNEDLFNETVGEKE
jgi:hypothetical protein